MYASRIMNTSSTTRSATKVPGQAGAVANEKSTTAAIAGFAYLPAARNARMACWEYAWINTAHHSPMNDVGELSYSASSVRRFLQYLEAERPRARTAAIPMFCWSLAHIVEFSCDSPERH